MLLWVSSVNTGSVESCSIWFCWIEFVHMNIFHMNIFHMIMFLQPKADRMNEDILYAIKLFKKQTSLHFVITWSATWNCRVCSLSCTDHTRTLPSSAHDDSKPFEVNVKPFTCQNNQHFLTLKHGLNTNVWKISHKMAKDRDLAVYQF